MTQEQLSAEADPPELPSWLNSSYIVEVEAVLFGQRLSGRYAVPREQWDGMGPDFQESYTANLIQRMGIEIAKWMASQDRIRVNVTPPRYPTASYQEFIQDDAVLSRPYRQDIKAEPSQMRMILTGGPLNGQERYTDGYQPPVVNLLYGVGRDGVNRHGTAVYARDEIQSKGTDAVYYRYVREL